MPFNHHVSVRKINFEARLPFCSWRAVFVLSFSNWPIPDVGAKFFKRGIIGTCKTGRLATAKRSRISIPLVPPLCAYVVGSRTSEAPPPSRKRSRPCKKLPSSSLATLQHLIVLTSCYVSVTWEVPKISESLPSLGAWLTAIITSLSHMGWSLLFGRCEWRIRRYSIYNHLDTIPASDRHTDGHIDGLYHCTTVQ